MPDNVVASPGSGGATFRTLEDASNIQHSAAAIEYATTVSAGANVLQPVTPASGLPVQPSTGAVFSTLGTAGTAVIGKVGIDQTTPGTTNAVYILGPAGTATVWVGGALRVEQIASQLFADTFDTGLDTTNRWTAPTTGGTGVAATSVVGQTVLSGGTTSNSFSEIHSQASFPPTEPGLLFNTFRIALEFPVLTTGYRFWGLATAPGSPTIASPLTNAAGFEIATTGKMYAVTYIAGTRTVIQDLSTSGNSKQPADALAHKYYLWFSGSLAYWGIDSLDNIVATMSTGADGPAVNTLPLKMLAVSNSGAAVTITCNGVNLGDTGKNDVQISDGTFPWRKQTVDSSGLAHVRSTMDLTTPGTTNAVSLPDQAAVTGTISAADAATTPTTGANGQTIITGSPTANSSVTGTVSGASSVVFTLTGNTGGSTYVVERSADAGTTFVATSVVIPGPSSTNPSIAANITAAKAIFHIQMAGYTTWRVRCATFVSGTTTIIGQTGYEAGIVATGITTSTAGVIGNVGGTTAAGASIAGNPLQTGGQAVNAEAAAVSTGQVVEASYTLTGKQIIQPFSNPENIIQYGGSATSGSAQTIFASQGAGVRSYITGLFLSNTSATTITVAISDGTTTFTFIVPAGSGSNVPLTSPMRFATATAVTWTASTGETTIYVNAVGYKGV
jgi:hypothetical protein